MRPASMDGDSVDRFTPPAPRGQRRRSGRPHNATDHPPQLLLCGALSARPLRVGRRTGVQRTPVCQNTPLVGSQNFFEVTETAREKFRLRNSQKTLIAETYAAQARDPRRYRSEV